MQKSSNDEFINNLVTAITGNHITDYELEYQATLTQDCLNAFINFITEFIEAKYSQTDAIRIKSSFQFTDDIFAKFPDLGDKFDDAYQSFLQSLINVNA